MSADEEKPDAKFGGIGNFRIPPGSNRISFSGALLQAIRGRRERDRARRERFGEIDKLAIFGVALRMLLNEMRPAVAEPPKAAEFCLALFLDKTKGDALIGDLSERFDMDCARFGAKRARRLYWGRALKSLWPLMRRLAARAIKLGVVIEYVRRIF